MSVRSLTRAAVALATLAGLGTAGPAFADEGDTFYHDEIKLEVVEEVGLGELDFNIDKPVMFVSPVEPIAPKWDFEACDLLPTMDWYKKVQTASFRGLKGEIYVLEFCYHHWTECEDGELSFHSQMVSSSFCD